MVSKRGPTVTKISGMTILDNDAVNAVSVLLTTVLTAYVCIYIFLKLYVKFSHFFPMLDLIYNHKGAQNYLGT